MAYQTCFEGADLHAMPNRADLGELALAALAKTAEPYVILDVNLDWQYFNPAAAELFAGAPPATDFASCCAVYPFDGLVDAVRAAAASGRAARLSFAEWTAEISALAPGFALVNFSLPGLSTVLDPFIEALPYGVLIATADGRIERVNSKFAEMLSIAREELSGRTIRSISHPDDPGLRAEALCGMGARERAVPLEARYVTPDGECVPVRLWVWCQCRDDGRPLRTVGLCEELTGDRVLTDEIKHSEWRFRSMIETSEDAIAILRADGSAAYRNVAAEQFFVHQPEEAQGASLVEVVHADDREAAKREFSSCVAQYGCSVRLELRLLRADQSWRRVDLWLRNLLHNPAISGVVAVARDLTDHIDAMHRLRAYSAEVEARNRELAGSLRAHDTRAPALLRSVSSELRTPIDGILDIVTVLLDTRLSAAQRDALERVRDSSIHLRSLLELIAGEP